MNLGIISEVMAGRRICMHSETFYQFRRLILANIDGRISSHPVIEKMSGGFIRLHAVEGGGTKMVRDYVGDAERISYWHGLEAEDRLINVVSLCGPMTRNGAECSYGSKDIRDMIIAAAKMPQTRGHIIFCDTHGGMASCLPDLRMAINIAHDYGQQVWMLIDGVCYSGGAFTSAICDKVCFVNPEDEIGSIGMFCSFFTLKDGDTNKIDSSVYHEYYASKSKDKNAWYREAAVGNMDLVAKETEADLDQLIANMKLDRPSILDEQMTGKCYKMRDVIGTLVDGQSDLETMAAEMFAEWDERQGAPLPHKDGAIASSEQKPEKDEPEPEENPEEGEESSETNNTNSNKNETMKTYTAIPAAIGEEPMETLDGSLDLTVEQAEALENVFAANAEALATAQNQLAEANAAHEAAMAEAQTAHETAMAEANTSHENALTEQRTSYESQISEMQSAHATEIENLNTQHASEIESLQTSHRSEIEALNSQLANIQTQVAQLQQQNEDLQATVTELNEGQGMVPQAGAAPASNGAAAPGKPRLKTSSVYDPRLTAEQNAENYLKAQKQLAKFGTVN